MNAEQLLNAFKQLLGMAEKNIKNEKSMMIKQLATGSFDIVHTKAADGKIYFKGVASTNTKDRGWDIVHQSGIKVRIPNKKLPILFNHNTDVILGFADKFKANKEQTQFEIEGYLDEAYTDERRQILASIKSGAASGLSIGFMQEEAEWNDKINAVEIKQIDLMEVSITPTPMNPEAVLTEIKEDDSNKDKEKSMTLDEEIPFNKKSSENAEPSPSDDKGNKEDSPEDKPTGEEEPTPSKTDEASVEELKAENEKLKERVNSLEAEVADYETTIESASEYISELETIKGVLK